MERADHDQRMKTLIKEFFHEFMRLFFSSWEKRLDCQHPEWLMQEAFPEPPAGPKRLMDLVAKVNTREATSDSSAEEHQQWLALVHIEIESADSLGTLSKRMYEYGHSLFNEHGLPVMPIALFLNVAYDGLGEETYVRRFFEFETLRFRYFYVGLRGLDGLQYVQGDNILGVALSALMNIPPDRVAWLGAEALRRLSEAPITEHQRYLLAECVQAYLPLDERQRQDFNRLLESQPYEGVKAMNKTIYEQGLEKGRVLERRETLRQLVADHFGPLAVTTSERIDQLAYDELAPLIRRVYQADSLKALGLED